MNGGNAVQGFVEWRGHGYLGRSRTGIRRGHNIFIGLLFNLKEGLIAGLQLRFDLFITSGEALTKAVTATLTLEVDSVVGSFLRIDFGRDIGS